MSRVSLIEQLYVKRKSALEFDYDALWAPPIMSIFTQEDINELYRIATSLKYNGNIEKKYELIDSVMRSRGFVKAHSGTNRVVYNFLELPTFIAKVAIDKVGMKDNPAEFKNQNYFKPFCCKIFEVDQTGVIAFVERVNPITSLEEFLSVSDDIFNLMVTKIIGKYVVDDLGASKFMNYGLRYNANGCTFGPVIIDFPYAYELDGAKLICKKPIKLPNGEEITCDGEIDYDEGLDGLICTKCGRKYKALDLQKHDKNVLVMYNSDKKGANVKMRSRIVDDNGNVIMDSGFSSDTHITKEVYESLPAFASKQDCERRQVPVDKTYRKKYKGKYNIRREAYTQLQTEAYNRMQNKGAFNSMEAAFDNASITEEYKPSGKTGIVVPVEHEEAATPVTIDITPSSVEPVSTNIESESNPLQELINTANAEEERNDTIVDKVMSAIEALKDYDEIGNETFFTLEMYGRAYDFTVEDMGPCETNEKPQKTSEESGVEINVNDIITDVTSEEDEDSETDNDKITTASVTDSETENIDISSDLTEEQAIVPTMSTDTSGSSEEFNDCMEKHDTATNEVKWTYKVMEEPDTTDEGDKDTIDVNDMVPAINPNKQYRNSNGRARSHHWNNNDEFNDYSDGMDEF